MAWIELHQTIWTHRKTLVLAAELGIEPDLAVARVVRLWCWSLDNCPDGDLSALPAAVLAAGANWTGDPKALVDALLRAGFLDRQDERLLLHDWWEYAGRLIERRRDDALRKRAARTRATSPPPPMGASPCAAPSPAAISPPSPSPAGASPPSVPPPGAVSQPSAGPPVDVQRNRTVPNSTVPNPTEPGKDDGVPPAVESAVAAGDAPADLNPAEHAVMDRLCAVLPGIRGSPHHERLLAALIRDYPAVDLPFEATRCRSHHGPSRRRWATTFADWITRARSVRFLDGSEGPPNAAMQPSPATAESDAPDFAPCGIPAWDAARRELAAAMLPSAYQQWFGCLHAVSLRDNTLTLEAPDQFHRTWLQDKLDHRIRQALADAGHAGTIPSYICRE